MTRIADAKNAVDHAQAQLASLTGNALAEAIAESGLGQVFGPDDIGLVLAVVRAIEQGPGTLVKPVQMTAPAQST